MNQPDRLDLAPAGAIWVCGACGKTARHRITGGIDRGWDESCYLHAVLCRDDDTLKRTQGGGRVVQAETFEEPQP